MFYSDTKLLKRKTSPLQLKGSHHLVPYHNDSIDQEYHEAGDDGCEPLYGWCPRKAGQYEEEDDEGTHEYGVGCRHSSAIDFETGSKV